MNSPQYHLRGVELFYGSNLALAVDELTIARGGLHVLAGPNGCGKSTLLNVLAFLNRPQRGEVQFAGTAVAWESGELNRLRRWVTLMHQHSYLFSGTVFSNVAYGLKVRGVSNPRLHEEVRASLARVGMSDFEERNARKLSGGEARRVALARALACRPEVLLLDEPLAYVDRDSGRVIEELVLSLVNNGTTVILSSHDEHFGQRTGGTVITMLEGRIERIDPPPEDRADDERTAAPTKASLPDLAN